MTEDIELLRLRAKAKLKLRSGTVKPTQRKTKTAVKDPSPLKDVSTATKKQYVDRTKFLAESIKEPDTSQTVPLKNIEENIAPSTYESIFPRTQRAKQEGKGTLPQVASYGLDIASLPGRFISATGRDYSTSNDFPDKRSIGSRLPKSADEWSRYNPTRPLVSSNDPAYQSRLKEMASLGDHGFVKNLIRDPATGVVVATLPATGPFVAGLAGGSALAPVAAGALEGIIGAGTHQVENVLGGKKLSIPEAATEIGISTVLPGIGAGLSTGAKKIGSKIIESVIKPSKKLKMGKGSKFNVQNIFKHKLDSPLGIKSMDKKIDNFIDDTYKQYGNEIKKIPKEDRYVDMMSAFKNTETRLNREISTGKHGNEIEGIKKGLNKWERYLQNPKYVKNPSKVPLKKVINMRKSIGKDAKFNILASTEEKGAVTSSDYLYKSINKKLDNFKQLRKLDKQLSEVRPLQDAVEEAIPIIEKNSLFGLPNIASMGGLGLVGAGEYSDNKLLRNIGVGVTVGSQLGKISGVGSVLNRPTSIVSGLGTSVPARRAATQVGKEFFNTPEEYKKFKKELGSSGSNEGFVIEKLGTPVNQNEEKLKEAFIKSSYDEREKIIDLTNKLQSSKDYNEKTKYLSERTKLLDDIYNRKAKNKIEEGLYKMRSMAFDKAQPYRSGNKKSR